MLILYSRALPQFSVTAQEYAKVTSTFHGAISFFCAVSRTPCRKYAISGKVPVWRSPPHGNARKLAATRLAALAASVTSRMPNNKESRCGILRFAVPSCSNRRNAFAEIFQNYVANGPRGPISSRARNVDHGVRPTRLRE